MQIAVSDEDVVEFMNIINRIKQDHPILVDKYLMGKEIEVDAVCDGEIFSFLVSWSISREPEFTQVTVFQYILQSHLHLELQT